LLNVITGTKLTNLNLSGLSKLEELNCTDNLLTSLDLTNCTSLLRVNAGYNKFTSFSLADNLKIESLTIENNKLLKNVNTKNLSKLKYISISNCVVEDLDLTDLAFLNSVNCDRNALSNLNLKGCVSLETLSCFTNQLKALDFSTCTKLSYFSGWKNLFKTLDFSNPDFSYIDCSENAELESFCIKNGKLINESSLRFTDNPKLKYICADDNEISLIQSKITSYGYITCHTNSYCSFVPSNVYYVIQGNQKLDNTNNGCDAFDFPISNLKFKITSSNSGFFITDSAGNYSLPVPSGAHRITPVFENPSYFSVSPATVNIVFPTASSPYTQNFCITPNGPQPDLEISLLPIDRARPGFDSSYKVIYKNKGNMMLSGTINITFNDAVLDLISANPVVTSQNLNNLSWNFTNLMPFESKEITFTIKVNAPTATPAVNNGDILVYTANITSTATDETPKDNTFTLNQIVVGSFDPNDKTCLEGSRITSALIGQYVHYMIRFENKGTYSAQNIVVKDMIDLSKFDIATLVPSSSSHSNITKISEGNKVEFIFENINLPFDDANNDGYIAFKIKTKPTLVVGDSFTNEANIYFDYNFPVLTNKATSTFKTVDVLNNKDFEFSNYFIVYPNPVNETLNMTTTKAIEIKSIAVYDILGQLVIALPNVKDTSKIDVSNLRTGNYFVKVISDRGSSSMMFIKN
jgi:hypothetical protein